MATLTLHPCPDLRGDLDRLGGDLDPDLEPVSPGKGLRHGDSRAPAVAPTRPHRSRPRRRRAARVPGAAAARVRTRRARAAGRRAREVRLTRRGRILVAVAAVIAVVALAASASLVLGGSGPTPTGDPRPAEVVVQPGQSLHDVALVVAPGADPVAVVDELRLANALPPAAEPRPGDRLVVPDRS